MRHGATKPLVTSNNEEKSMPRQVYSKKKMQRHAKKFLFIDLTEVKRNYRKVTLTIYDKRWCAKIFSA